MVLLDKMKSQLSSDPEARQAFRENDVQVILEHWDGHSPMFWFSWEIGTHLMMLGDETETEAWVLMIKRKFMVAAEMARGGRVFMIEEPSSDGSYELTALDFTLARDTLAEYYRCKAKPTSTHQPQLYS